MLPDMISPQDAQSSCNESSPPALQMIYNSKKFINIMFKVIANEISN